MVKYQCFQCDKKITLEPGRRVRCPYCGSKMLSKFRTTKTIVRAV
jgi:DNA-directed RNA polymerase subunit RPC12/RpoP